MLSSTDGGFSNLSGKSSTWDNERDRFFAMREISRLFSLEARPSPRVSLTVSRSNFHTSGICLQNAPYRLIDLGFEIRIRSVFFSKELNCSFDILELLFPGVIGEPVLEEEKQIVTARTHCAIRLKGNLHCGS